MALFSHEQPEGQPKILWLMIGGKYEQQFLTEQVLFLLEEQSLQSGTITTIKSIEI